MAQAQHEVPVLADRQGHTQTIAAQLYRNPHPNKNELSAQDFLRQMEIFMLGNNVMKDSHKLSFALNTLQGGAHECFFFFFFFCESSPSGGGRNPSRFLPNARFAESVGPMEGSSLCPFSTQPCLSQTNLWVG